MTLEPGTVLDRYEVLDRIGVGGMGEVYRARDSRLHRTVALKTISTAYSDDPTSLPRFERERSIATRLEHPHICRLLDTGRERGVEFLVMEYLDGESLAVRLRRGALRLPEALGYAIEISDALAHAHRAGVVHRDVKPANVFLTAAGAKVLDFGVSTLRTIDRGAPVDQAITAPGNPGQIGAVVGTPLYLAPERLEGCEADHRTDVFGFGLVLYEMLTGRRAFSADSSAALIAAILTADPPPMELADGLGPDLEWVVRRCLAKRPEDRWQSMSDVGLVLRRIAHRGAVRSAPPRGGRRWMGAIAAAAAVLVATSVVVWWGTRPSPPAPLAERSTVFTVPPPAGGFFTLTEGSVQTAQLALSRDGSALAFVASDADGGSQLWIRRMDSPVLQPLPGSTDAAYPFWSYDGRSLGFFTRGEMRRIDVSGGPARTIAPAQDGRGGTWSANGTILFAANTAGTIYRVPAEGGSPVAQTRFEPARAETSHRWPQFLPDGQHFIYFVGAAEETHEGIYLSSLSSAEPTLVLNTGFGAAYAEPGRLFYLDDDTLMVRTLDIEARRTSGDPRPVAESVGGSSNFYGAFSVSNTGVVAYASMSFRSQLVWFDREGERRPETDHRGGYVDFDLSATDRMAAVAEIDPVSDRSDIYLLDLSRGSRQRLTAARETDASPIWSPDGTRVVFRSNRDRVHDLYVRTVHGSGPEQIFFKSPLFKYPTSWSPDAGFVLFHAKDGTQWDVWRAPVEAPGAARRLIQTPFDEMQAQISPDGRYVAYTSNESSALEVYVQPVDAASPRWLVSAGGGSDPKWAGDRPELYYLAPTGWLTAVKVPVATAAPESPRALFRAVPPVVAEPYTSVYDVARDGSRFLFRVSTEDARTVPLRVRLESTDSSAAQ